MHAARNANTSLASARTSDLVAGSAGVARAALRGTPRFCSRPPRLQAPARVGRRRAARWPIPPLPGRPLYCAFRGSRAGAPPRLSQPTRFEHRRAARRRIPTARRTTARIASFALYCLCASVSLPPNPPINRTVHSRLWATLALTNLQRGTP